MTLQNASTLILRVVLLLLSTITKSGCVRACVRARVCVCARACVCSCVRACVVFVCM